MPNYQNGKIYKITGGNLVYYGSTTLKLCQRLADHKKCYKRYKEGKTTNTTSFQLLDFEDCYITLVELFSCNSKEELLARERFYIENNDCVNKVIPLQTDAEYYKKNKEEFAERTKKWREENVEKSKEIGRKSYYNTIETSIAYRDKNKEKIREYSREYYKKKKALKENNNNTTP
jgi:hypothetical protein